MDKRTIIFSLLVFATLFLTNFYFDSEYDEKLRQWKITQEVKKLEQVKTLEHEIVEKTAPTKELPLYFAYANDKETTALAGGILTGDSFVAISWNNEPPQSIYIAPQDNLASRRSLKLTYNPHDKNAPVIYQPKEKAPLLIGNLPDIGSYELQAVTFNVGDNQPKATVWVADYLDGTVIIANDRIAELKKELDPKAPTSPPSMPANSILLIKSDSGYLPIGIYDQKSKSTAYLEDVPGLETILPDSKEISKGTPLKSEQQFYVLENDYQQLVFSSVGGALVEINLPFTSQGNTQNVVRPIEFDREIMNDHPYNAHFPAHPYLTPGAKSSGPFVENSTGKLGGYYPLIRRDLILNAQGKSTQINPRYYALNLLSEYPELAELQYSVKHFDRNSITFEGQQRQRKITKTFSFPNNVDAPYCFDLKIKIEGEKRGLWLSSGVPEVELFSGTPDPILKYRITRNQKSSVENIDLPSSSYTNSSANPDWLCNSNGFFGIIVDPLIPVDPGFRAVHVPGQTVPTRLVEIDESNHRYDAKDFPGYLMMTPLRSTGSSSDFRIFAGPFSSTLLKNIDASYSDPATGYNPDYIACQTYHGWFSFISEPFAKLLFILMNFFHTITGSWAFSIVLLTLALRLMLYPLNAWSTRSMLRMQEVAPLVATIQEKYKKDPKKMQAEIMNLYREKGANPMSGCVPMLIQMPFLIGMFDLLKSTFELRGASFIPGWIDNLTSPDVLFSWHTPIFFIGNQFHLLPVLLGIVMFFQQRMSAAAIDPSQMTDQQRQQRAMGTVMPIVFAFMFYSFPSGLNIYWLSSMLLAMLQQWWMQSRMKQNNKVDATIKTPSAVKSKKL